VLKAKTCDRIRFQLKKKPFTPQDKFHFLKDWLGHVKKERQGFKAKQIEAVLQ